MAITPLPGSSSDPNLLSLLYTIQVDPNGTLGASDGVAFSKDGTILAASNNLADAILYDALTGAPLGVTVDHANVPFTGGANSDGEINAIDFSVNDALFVTGANNLGAKVWETATGNLVTQLNNGTNTDGAAFSPDGRWLATAADGNVNIYDVNNNFSLVTSFLVSTREVNSIDWSSNSQFLVVGAGDGATLPDGTTASGIRLYDTSNWSFVRDFAIDSSTKKVQFSPDDRYLAIGARASNSSAPNTEPGITRVFDVQTGELVADLQQQGNLVALALDDQDRRVATEAVTWSKDGNYLFTSGVIDGLMRVWRVADWSLVGWAQAQDNNRAIESIDITTDGRVAIGGDDGTVRVYQFNAPEILPPIQSDRGAGNIISIEAENSDTNLSQGGFSWEKQTEPVVSAGFFMQSTPNNGTVFNTNFQTFDPTLDSPKLDYRVNFTETGTYFVWVRMKGGSGNNSVHVGLNGEAIPTADRIGKDPNVSGWQWTQDTGGGTVATIDITSIGENTVNLWMREDGVAVDKIILTTDPNYNPNLENFGFGATQSDRASSTRYEAELANLGTGVVAVANNPGFSGNGFVDYPSTVSNNTSIEWTFNVAAAGDYTLDFGYANGSNRDRPLELNVNGTVADPSLSFISTGNWSTWDTSSTTVNLAAGLNTITLTANSVRGPNLDYLDVTPIPVNPGNFAVSGENVLNLDIAWTATADTQGVFDTYRGRDASGRQNIPVSTETAVYSNSQTLIATTAKGDGTVRLFDAASGEQIWQQNATAETEAASFTANDEFLVSGGEAATAELEVRRVSDGSLVRQIDDTRSIEGLEFSPDFSLLATGNEAGEVKIYDTSSLNPANWTLLHTLTHGADRDLPGSNTNAQSDVNQLRWSADGQFLYSGGRNAEVKKWRVANFGNPDGGLERTYLGNTGSVKSVRLSPDGSLLAAGSNNNSGGDARVVVWDELTGQQVLNYAATDLRVVENVAFDPTGNVLVAGGTAISGNRAQSNTPIWRVSDILAGETLPDQTITWYDVEYLEFNDTGSTLISSHGDGSVRAWDVAIDLNPNPMTAPVTQPVIV